MPRPIVILPLLLLLLLGARAPDARSQSAPHGWAPPQPFAGYALVEASYLLRAPDGSLLRVTRPGPAAQAGAAPWGAAPGTSWSDADAGSPTLRPVLGFSGWLSGWLLRNPHPLEQLGDYVRETWAVILRLLDYLGVVVLLGGSWAVWFLARPALLGVSDRAAFLFVFVLASGLWAYVTQLYLSVAYALGLMLLPALAAMALAWLARRTVALLRRPTAPAP